MHWWTITNNLSNKHIHIYFPIPIYNAPNSVYPAHFPTTFYSPNSCISTTFYGEEFGRAQRNLYKWNCYNEISIHETYAAISCTTGREDNASQYQGGRLRGSLETHRKSRHVSARHCNPRKLRYSEGIFISSVYSRIRVLESAPHVVAIFSRTRALHFLGKKIRLFWFWMFHILNQNVIVITMFSLLREKIATAWYN